MDIVCLSTVAWNALWQRHQQLMWRLSERHRVLFVEPAKNVLSAGLCPRVFFRWIRGPRRIRDRLFVYTPPPSVPLRSVARGWNRAAYVLLGRLVDGVARRLGFRHVVLWLTYPNAVDAADQIQNDLLCFDCADNFSAYPDIIGKKTLDLLQKTLYTISDIVFVVSPELVEEARQWRFSTFLVPNGGDQEQAERTWERQGEGLPGMSAIEGPVIGFVGALYEWVDFQLIQYVARARPAWSIVLIGPIRPRRSRKALGRFRNIHLLGRRAYGDIHRYIEQFDVCLLPFRSDLHMGFADPIVTYDYLLMGKPVVCTDFPQARRLGDLVCVEGKYNRFVFAIEECLREDGVEWAMKRRSFAQANSWDHRVRRIEQVIAARMRDRVISNQQSAIGNQQSGIPSRIAGGGADGCRLSPNGL